MMTDPNELLGGDRAWNQTRTVAPNVDEVREANAALAQVRGHEARWWAYRVSHCYFEIVVGSPLGDDNVVLGLGACERIAGPVGWLPQQIEVTVQQDPGDSSPSPRYVLQDSSVNFRAVGRLFRWKKCYDIWAHHHLPMYGRGSKAGMELDEQL